MKRIFKPALSLILLLALFSFLPCHQTVQAQTTKLTNKTTVVTMKKGTKTTLKLSFTKKAVKWSSSKKSVAKITAKGKLTAVKKGTAKITAAYGNKKFGFKVKVVTSGSKKITVTETSKSTAPSSKKGSTDDDPLPAGGTVWIPRTGSKYHSTSTCSNMKSPSAVSLSEAVSRGYTACSKCW